MLNFINAEYRRILIACYHGVAEQNARTGVECKTATTPQTFEFLSYGSYYPVLGNRYYSTQVAAAECAWQLIGTQDPSFIMKYAPKLWNKFIENGIVKNAYGYRWRSHFNRDQISLAQQQLVDNPTNRQLWISTWDPGKDGLGCTDKNTPCIVGFNLRLIDERLYMQVVLRSSDVVVGLPYDILVYTMTMYYIAWATGKKPGGMHFTLLNAHYYNTPEQRDVIEKSLDPYHQWLNNHHVCSAVSWDDYDNFTDWVDAHKGLNNGHDYKPNLEVVV